MLFTSKKNVDNEVNRKDKSMIFLFGKNFK